MNTDSTDLVLADQFKLVTADAIKSWSDTRRKDFVGTFKNRVLVAREILWHTAQNVMRSAEAKSFISRKHSQKITFPDVPIQNRGYGSDTYKNLGRSAQEINELANARSEKILKELPPLHKAIEILDKETSEKIVKRDDLIGKCRKLTEKFNTASETIKMSDLDQDMTVGEFRKMVKDREKERNKLALEINEFAKEARELDGEIHKKLYSGIPGLSEAVVSAITQHLEKCKALEQLTRRVEEKVLFGDSDAAMTILKKFEEDELVIPDQIKADFKKALEALKVKPVKTLTKATAKKKK